MGFCCKMKSSKFLVVCFIFIFLFALINAEETTTPTADTTAPTTQPSVNILQQNMNSVVDEKSGVTTYTFGEDSAIQIGKTNFMSVQPSSENTKAVLKVDKEGTILEADLTAKSQTTWKFNDQSVNVPEGARVTFKDGKIEVFGKDNDVIKVETPRGKQDITFAKDYSVGSLSSSFDRKINPLQIQDNHITGKNFEVGGLSIKEGGVTLTDTGVLLDANSASSYNQVKVSNKEPLLFSNSDDFGNSQNALFMGENTLKAKGNGFDLDFNSGNPYAKIESGDHFKISAIDGTEISLANRDSTGKIPLLDMNGDFSIEQDSKIFRTNQDKFFVDKSLFPNSGTSPIELKIEGQDRKYLVSNFKGIASVSLDAESGVTDENYANSIYPKKASTEVRYNYPTAKDFESLTGGKISFLTEGLPKIAGQSYSGVSKDDMIKLIDNPQDMRALIDYYETLPENAKTGISTIKIYGPNEYSEALKEGNGLPTALAFYDNRDNSLNIKGVGFAEDCSGGVCSFGIFSHESSHAIDKHILDLSQEDFKTFTSSWQEVSGEQKGYDLLDKNALKNLGFKWDSKTNPEGAFKGYVSPYGALNEAEDRAEYIRMIKSEPSFFNKNNLFDEKTPYSAVYKQKIDLLLKSGFITKPEYDSVFK